MKFLVYSATPTEENATLDSYKDSMDKELSRIMYTLERMDLDRLLDHESVGLLVDNIRLNASKDYITADIYKQANPDSALHGFKKEGGTVTVQEILSEQDDAFKKGLLGVKK